MVESVNAEENIFTLRKLMIDCRNTAKAEELQKQQYLTAVRLAGSCSCMCKDLKKELAYDDLFNSMPSGTDP